MSLAQADARRAGGGSERRMGRVLILAGSDSGGGAGVQADIKAVTMMGGFAATAITAITVQNTLGVHGVHPLPLELIAAQARAVLEDIGTDAVKTGMLGSVEVVETVAALLDEAKAPAVVDPVMVAKGGHPLLPDAAVEAVRRLMIPRAALLTPNAPEAEALTGLTVRDIDGQRRAGEALLKHLSLLFVPAGVGLIAFGDRLLAEGTRLIAVLFVSTALTMIVTALVFRALAKPEDE